MSIIKRTANRSPFLYLYVLFSAFCRRCGFCGCLSCCSGCFSSGLHFALLLSDYSVVVGICKEQSIMRTAVYAIFTDSSSDTCLYNLSVSCYCTSTLRYFRIFRKRKLKYTFNFEWTVLASREMIIRTNDTGIVNIT